MENSNSERLVKRNFNLKSTGNGIATPMTPQRNINVTSSRMRLMAPIICAELPM